MRRQCHCSKCEFASSSTRRSVNTNPSKPVCNSCRTNGNKSNKLVTNSLPPPKQAIDDEISPNSFMHKNVALTVNQIGMVFGNLTFEPNTALPMMPKLKPKVGLGDSMGHQDNVYYGTTLKSLLGQDEIQIQQEEYDYEEMLPEATKTPLIWDPKNVQKKNRSKLHQHTLSPLQRLLNQLHRVSHFNPNLDKQKHHIKYDDVLIYEKCKFVADNEIGVGAMLLPQPVAYSKKRLFKQVGCSTSSANNIFKKRDVASSYSTKEIKQHPRTNDTTDAYSSLVDVPIRSTPFE